MNMETVAVPTGLPKENPGRDRGGEKWGRKKLGRIVSTVFPVL